MEFGSQWEHVGYILGLEHSLLKTIELNSQKVEKCAFRMLEEWMQQNVKPCYCKLISAMHEEGLNQGVEILRKNIESSEFLTCCLSIGTGGATGAKPLLCSRQW